MLATEVIGDAMSKLSIAVNADDHIQGNPSAECSLVEYGDYQCPYLVAHRSSSTSQNVSFPKCLICLSSITYENCNALKWCKENSKGFFQWR
jgi:hypothetical protein